MRAIPVSNGKAHAFVSEEDYARVSACNWFLTGNGYAFRWLPRNGGPKRSVMMHRFVMSATKGTEIDHINGDKLDNRRDNLRFVDHGSNQQKVRRALGVSGLRGVRSARNRGWWARINVGGVEMHLGTFITKEEAAAAYDAAALRYYGHHALLNNGAAV